MVLRAEAIKNQLKGHLGAFISLAYAELEWSSLTDLAQPVRE